MAHESSQRVLLSMMLLAVLWIGVYWGWGPSEGVPSVTFDRPVGGGAAAVVDERGAGDVVAERPVLREPGGAGGDEDVGGGESSGPLRVEPPRFREHTVRAGETLESIARRAYGEGRYWRAIAQANPLMDAERIDAGDVIRLPIDPDNVQGVLVDAAGDRAEPAPAAPPEFVEYLVKSGDTLSEIALSYYGSMRYADLIYEANGDVMRSRDDLRLGATLRLPAKPNP